MDIFCSLKFCFFRNVKPFEILRFKFMASWLCQVNLLIITNALFIVLRATAHKTGVVCGYGVPGASPVFQPAGLTVCI
jgi:hypothetical protein